LRVAADVVAEHDGFRNFLHGFALLPALALQSQVGLFFVQAEIALQDAFGALDNLSGLQLLGQRGVGFLKPCQLELRPPEIRLWKSCESHDAGRRDAGDAAG